MRPMGKSKVAARYSVSSNVRFILSAIREYDGWLLPFVGLNVVFTAMGQFVPVVMPKLIIDELTGAGRSQAVLLYAVLFGTLLLICGGMATTSGNTISFRFIAVRLKLIARSGRKFMGMDFQNLEDPKILDMSQKGDRACDNNQNGLEGVMHRVQGGASKALALVGTGAVITMLNPLILAALFALLVANFVVSSNTRTKDKAENDLLAPVWRRLGYLGSTMSDFSFAKDIRLFTMQGFLRDRYTDEQAKRFGGQVRIWKLWATASNFFAITSLLQEVLLYAWLCWSVLYRGMTIGDFTMYAAAIRAFTGALGGLLDDISHIRQQNEVICDYREFLDHPDRGSGGDKVPADIARGGMTFEFDDVSFRYPGQEKYVLEKLSLRIGAGERLAVVGLNGAGKSTFVKLLTRLYEPESGRILLNGVDVRTYDKKEYYGLFSTVFQEIEMFAFTVAENVSMAEYEKTDMGRVRGSIERAGLGEVVSSLPHGIDQRVLKVIEENGVEFSGGQSQKLALARALYKDAPVIVLDEPTASLDSLAEERLYKEFDSLTSGKTAIFISHRLASTRFCDRVAMFEGGRIGECGPHSELMAQGGRYAEVYAMQAKYYNEDVAV